MPCYLSLKSNTYHCEVVIVVMWKRMRLLGSENLTVLGWGLVYNRHIRRESDNANSDEKAVLTDFVTSALTLCKAFW